jgi:hypothetical protein
VAEVENGRLKGAEWTRNEHVKQDEKTKPQSRRTAELKLELREEQS